MRKLTAIMYSDIVGFARLTRKNETRARELMEKARRVIKSLVDQHDGEWLKEMGDSQLSCFDSPVDAINCAITIQEKLANHPDLKLRIAIHIGDLEFEDGDVTGSGMNVASRIEPMAAPNGICISGRVYRSRRVQEELSNQPDLEARPLGEISTENINEPQSVYALVAEGVSKPIEASRTKSKDFALQPRSLIATGIGILLLIFLGAGIWWYNGAETESEHKLSVAVLPFDDFSKNGDQEWFSDGLTEEILNSLARLGELYVPARTSSFVFKGKNLPIQQIADSLNVNHLVEGSVRRSGDRMRIAVQLIRAEDGGHVWSKTYNRPTDSVFSVQKDIAENIASTLDIYLDEEQRKRMFAFGTRNVKAYEAFLKGEQMHHAAHQAEPLSTLWDANSWYDKAISLDSTFAFPYQRRTDPYYHFINGQMSAQIDTLSRKEAYDRIIADFNRSIRYSNNPANRLLYRFNKSFFAGNWDQIPELARKIHDNPDAYQSFVLTGGGAFPTGFIGTGYGSLAHELYREKIKQDPLNDSFKFYDALALLSLGKPEVVLQEYREYISEMPVFKAGIHVHAGQIEKARQMLANLNPSEPGVGLIAYKILLGMKEVSKQELDTYAAEYGNSVAMILYVSAGYPDKADSLAHIIDESSLFPCKKLAPVAGNVLNFDLDATPNLALCFEQANITTKPYSLGGIEVRRIVQKDL